MSRTNPGIKGYKNLKKYENLKKAENYKKQTIKMKRNLRGPLRKMRPVQTTIMKYGTYNKPINKIGERKAYYNYWHKNDGKKRTKQDIATYIYYADKRNARLNKQRRNKFLKRLTNKRFNQFRKTQYMKLAREKLDFDKFANRTLKNQRRQIVQQRRKGTLPAGWASLVKVPKKDTTTDRLFTAAQGFGDVAEGLGAYGLYTSGVMGPWSAGLMGAAAGAKALGRLTQIYKSGDKGDIDIQHTFGLGQPKENYPTELKSGDIMPQTINEKGNLVTIYDNKPGNHENYDMDKYLEHNGLPYGRYRVYWGNNTIQYNPLPSEGYPLDKRYEKLDSEGDTDYKFALLKGEKPKIVDGNWDTYDTIKSWTNKFGLNNPTIQFRTQTGLEKEPWKAKEEWDNDKFINWEQA